jgi:DNA-directed RNA polymerase subunit RPC12/RpoP
MSARRLRLFPHVEWNDDGTARDSARYVARYACADGGYPVALLMDDTDVLCHDCTRGNYRLILESTRDGFESGWCARGMIVNWEDAALFCAHCSGRIPSAYAEPECTECGSTSCACKVAP